MKRFLILLLPLLSFLYSQQTTLVMPYNLAVNSGYVPGKSFVDKFGENPDIDTGTVPEDVWEYGGVYPYDDTNTAPIKYLSSSSTNDNVSLSVQGLDIDGNSTEILTNLTGQTVVELATPLWRVYRMANMGSVDIVGTVYCHTDPTPTGGVPTSTAVRAVIDNGNNQTLMALYTIPKGKVGFLLRGEIGVSRSQTSGSVQAAYYSRRYGMVFRVKKRVDLSVSGSSIFQDYRTAPDIIPALTDIKIRIEEVSANNAGIFATLDIMLVDESAFTSAYLSAIGQVGY